MNLLKMDKRWMAFGGKKPIGKYAKWKTEPCFDTYPDAIKYKNIEKDGVGFITGQGIVCIDLDHVLVPDTKGYEFAMELVEEADTYTEASRSGLGLHIIGYYDGCVDESCAVAQSYRSDNGYGCEAFIAPHMVAFTGNHIKWTPNTLHNINETVDKVVAICSLSHGAGRVAAPSAPQNVPRTIVRMVDGDLPEFRVDDIWNIRDGMNTCPTCGSTHNGGRGLNFSYNKAKDVWMCFHDGRSGGGAMLALAVDEGIINCKDARPGALRGMKFIEVKEAAKRRFKKTTVTFK